MTKTVCHMSYGLRRISATASCNEQVLSGMSSTFPWVFQFPLSAFMFVPNCMVMWCSWYSSSNHLSLVSLCRVLHIFLFRLTSKRVSFASELCTREAWDFKVESSVQGSAVTVTYSATRSPCYLLTIILSLFRMGASHDGHGPVNHIPGNNGAYHCRWEDGFIMSYVDGDLNHFRFSSCSVEQIRLFLG